jgi:hypothetical protein
VADDPWRRICSGCGRARGFLPSSRTTDLAQVRATLAKGWTLPLVGVMVCPRCDLDPHLIGFPRLAYVLDVAAVGQEGDDRGPA